MSALCTNMRIVFSTWTVLNLPLLSGCLYAIYKYIRFRNEINYTSLYFIGLIYIFTTFLFTILDIIWGIHGIMLCSKPNILYEDLQMIFYALQTYFLWILLVIRCFLVFKGSVYQLSNATKNLIFVSLFIIMPILFLLSITFSWPIARWVLITILFVFSMAFYIWITLLFIYKLYSVFKNSKVNDNSGQLLETITKNTILAIFSFIATFVAIITWIVIMSVLNDPDDHFSSENSTLSFIYHFTFLIDIYTNFICAILMFNLFTKQYQWLCGCIDLKFMSYCNKYIDNQLKAAIKLEMQLNETKSNTVTSKTNTSTATTTNTNTSTIHSIYNTAPTQSPSSRTMPMPLIINDGNLNTLSEINTNPPNSLTAQSNVIIVEEEEEDPDDNDGIVVLNADELYK